MLKVAPPESKLAYAEEPIDPKETPAQRYWRITKKVVPGPVGLGLGTLAGVSGGVLADAIHKKVTGKPIPMHILLGIAAPLGAATIIAKQVYDRNSLATIDREAAR